MDIYFDFEATQFSERIISIGATCQNGDFGCFISSFSKKITPFITKLTGITKEMVTGAPTVDEAFIDLYTWINELSLGEKVNYHCYGNSDKSFLLKTAKDIKNENTADFVKVLANNLIDDSLIVNHYFKTSSIGVYNALKNFEPELSQQTHDAVDDAILLYKLMEHIKEIAPEVLEYVPIASHKKTKHKKKAKVKKSPYKIHLIHSTEVNSKLRVFETDEDAINWMRQKIRKRCPEAKEETIRKNTLNAINNDGVYKKWRFTKVYDN